MRRDDYNRIIKGNKVNIDTDVIKEKLGLLVSEETKKLDGSKK